MSGDSEFADGVPDDEVDWDDVGDDIGADFTIVDEDETWLIEGRRERGATSATSPET